MEDYCNVDYSNYENRPEDYYCALREVEGCPNRGFMPLDNVYLCKLHSNAKTVKQIKEKVAIRLIELSDDHDCKTPQGDGCRGCSEIQKLNQWLGGSNATA